MNLRQSQPALLTLYTSFLVFTQPVLRSLEKVNFIILTLHLKEIEMKKLMTLFFALTSFIYVSAQIDTTLSDYFPLDVGNYWEYTDNLQNLWKMEAIKDTIMPNGKTYTLIRDSSDWWGAGTIYYNFYRIDDSMRVWEYVGNWVGNCDGEYLTFNLPLPDRAVWTTCIDLNNPDSTNNFPCLAWTQNKFYPSLNFAAIEKTFCGALVDTTTGDTTICESFYYDLFELARGIGLARRASDEQIFISGAIIRGVQYGTILSVEKIENYLKDENGSFEIYPNPFNAESVISFILTKSSDVKICIYDMLGREIASISKGYLAPGKYQERLIIPEESRLKLSSGIYLVSLITEQKIKTKKVVLLK